MIVLALVLVIPRWMSVFLQCFVMCSAMFVLFSFLLPFGRRSFSL